MCVSGGEESRFEARVGERGAGQMKCTAKVGAERRSSKRLTRCSQSWEPRRKVEKVESRADPGLGFTSESSQIKCR